jgi:hypothetical protein
MLGNPVIERSKDNNLVSRCDDVFDPLCDGLVLRFDRHTERGLCRLDDTAVDTSFSHWRSPDADPKRINALLGSKQGPPLRNPDML